MSRLEQAPVSHARHSLTYTGLLTLPGARRAFGAAAVARLSFGMAGLSLLLLIHQATGSFAAAGAAGGAFSAGTLTAPVKARLIDRRGQRVMLPLLGLGAAAAMLAMALLDRAAYRNPLPYVAACAAAGALTPPVGAAMRARWAVIAGGGRNLERAYSLDAATEETLFTAGPLLTGLAVTVAGPVLPMLVTAALLAAGCVLLAGSGSAAPARDPRPGGPAGPLAVPGFRRPARGRADDVARPGRDRRHHHRSRGRGPSSGRGRLHSRRREPGQRARRARLGQAAAPVPHLHPDDGPAGHHGGRHRGGRRRPGSAAGRRRAGADRNRSRPVGGAQLPQRRTPGRTRRRGVNVGEHRLERRRRGRARAHRRGGQPGRHDDAAAGGRGRAGLRGPRGAAPPERLRCTAADASPAEQGRMRHGGGATRAA